MSAGGRIVIREISSERPNFRLANPEDMDTGPKSAGWTRGAGGGVVGVGVWTTGRGDSFPFDSSSSRSSSSSVMLLTSRLWTGSSSSSSEVT